MVLALVESSPLKLRSLLLRPLAVGGLFLTACTSPSPQPVPSALPLPQDPAVVPRDPGPECSTHVHCEAYTQRHATWCTPHPEQRGTLAHSPVELVPGTIDTTAAHDTGCRCVNGWCGAKLNDTRTVIGPQADPQGITYVDECQDDADCHPQEAAHGTWCGPAQLNFYGALVEAVAVDGTLDGGSCHCWNGRCGAQLNDGRRVVGPQPRAPSP